MGGSKFKASGVKKLLLLGVAPEMKEKPELLEGFFENLNLTPGSFTFCPDLKLANLLVGIGSHSSKHPSAFCNWEKNTEKPCTLRTFEGIHSNYRKWKKAGSDPKTAKDFENCVRKPSRIFPKKGNVISYIALVALHIFMGVVNKLYSELESEFPQACEWPKKLHLMKEEYFGKFEGKMTQHTHHAHHIHTPHTHRTHIHHESKHHIQQNVRFAIFSFNFTSCILSKRKR